jgi:spore maturation protein CgeB
MRFVLFYHSLISDWNHGNAHFLRGICTELLVLGHTVSVFEPARGWSLSHLLAENGGQAVEQFHAAYPHLRSSFYDSRALDLDQALDGADVVIVHEWTDPSLVARIGSHRSRSRYRLFFHDTHHRAVSAPEELQAYDLSGYDGVLAFGQVLRDVYMSRGWAARAWVWHEAADIRVFRPLPKTHSEPLDMVWIGNWGDGEREQELQAFLLEPVRDLCLRARVYGVRYPPHALTSLHEAGIDYAGWAPNFQVPGIYAAARTTVHVPRRFYRDQLTGIPTIRMFEALACGIALVSAPWRDTEGLLQSGRDYLLARDGTQMQSHLRALLADAAYARAVAEQGHRTVCSRHTCAHRVRELLAICRQLGAGAAVSLQAASNGCNPGPAAVALARG